MSKQDTPSDDRARESSPLDALEIARRLQVGSFLSRKIKEKDWTQKRLAKAAGCSQTMISKICTGQAKPSEDLIQCLLTALKLPLDSIDKLPGLGFDPGSDGFQLKITIIRALIANEIPTDGSVDAREFIENEWDNPAYREARRSSNLDDAVWSSLVADHYFRTDDECRYIPLPVYYDLKGNLLLYIAAMVSGMSSVRNVPTELRAKAIATFDHALQAWEDSLNKPDQLASAIDACSYSLAAGDRMLVAALLGHASALRFFLEVGASVIAGNADHYAAIVMPFFEATLKSLQMARNQMVSDTVNPTQNVMADLSISIDKIFVEWREQGFLDSHLK